MNTAFECPLFIYVVSFRLAIISQQFIMIDIYKSNRSNPSRYMFINGFTRGVLVTQSRKTSKDRRRPSCPRHDRQNALIVGEVLYWLHF